MAQHKARVSHHENILFVTTTKMPSMAAALSAGLLASGCAQISAFGGPDLLASSNAPAANRTGQAGEEKVAIARSDLQEATDYWGKLYGKNPSNLEAAIAYAKNLKAMGQKRQALAVLQQANRFHGTDRKLAAEYGRVALELGQISVAQKVLAHADDPANPNWRVISARGTVMAKQGKYKKAIPFYERALTLAHNQPSVLNNLAMALAMQGEPEKAETMLRQAAATHGATPRIRQNLALVLGLQGKYAESKQVATRDQSAEKASDNTNYLRRLTQLEPKQAPQTAAAATQVATQTLKPAVSADSTEAGSWDSKVAVATTSQ